MSVEILLAAGAAKGASDLFLTAGKRPVMRFRGLLSFSGTETIQGEEIDRFRKTAAGTAGEAVYQETGSCDSAWTSPEKIRFRINFFATLSGPAMAVRPVASGNKLSFPALNLPPVLEKICRSERGMILVTGSTGSGKSTTLGAMIHSINSHFEKHILTIEDPVEYVHQDEKSIVSQREIRTGSVSFSSALRSALRENPDVIVIGEIRDRETAETALSAALTGHLVIATVHTADTVQALSRIISLFPEEAKQQAAMDLGESLQAVLAQRLIPLKDGSGMIPVMEILMGTPAVKKYVADNDPQALEEALRQGSESGMVPFTRAVFRLYRDGKISVEEARKAAGFPDEFDLLVKGMESGVDVFRNHYGSLEEGERVDMKRLLRTALSTGASDLHLSAGSPPMVRISGEMRAMELPALTPGDIRRLLFSILTRSQRIELEEKRELDLALSVRLTDRHTGKEFTTRFRVNGFYQRGSLGTVIRVVNTTIPKPEKLGLPPEMISLADKKQGLILVTGPTGSGKSTTLASLIDWINREKRCHIITIEDPIEYVHTNLRSVIEQRELHSDTLSFSSALKYALRQDPDVVMVGEMRDVDTMEAVLTAAETGHLVLATVHTNSAPQTIDRIIDSFPSGQQNQIRVQLAGVLLGVLSQRLLTKRDGSGRCAAFELLIGTPPIQALIRDGKTFQIQSVMETSWKDGMFTLEKSLQALCEKGWITEKDTKLFHADYRLPEEY